jgi:hypothetical protein
MLSLAKAQSCITNTVYRLVWRHSKSCYIDNLLFCNICGTFDKMCGSMVFPPSAQANRSRALSAAMQLLQNQTVLLMMCSPQYKLV